MRESEPLHHLTHELVHDIEKSCFFTHNFYPPEFTFLHFLAQDRERRKSFALFIYFVLFLLTRLPLLLTKQNHLRLCAFFHVVLSLYSHFSMKFNRGYVNLLNYFFVRLRVYQTPEFHQVHLHIYSLCLPELFCTYAHISVDFIY